VGLVGEGVFVCTNKVKNGVVFNCVFVINLVVWGRLFLSMELF
jgi:hypothetical protein